MCDMEITTYSGHNRLLVETANAIEAAASDKARRLHAFCVQAGKLCVLMHGHVHRGLCKTGI